MFSSAPTLLFLASLSVVILSFGAFSARQAAAEPFDPMRPPAGILSRMPQVLEGKDEGEQAWTLQSILIAGGRRVAIVNNQSVRQGDRIGDAEVVFIDSSAIELNGPDGPQRLELHTHVKRPSRAVRD